MRIGWLGGAVVLAGLALHFWSSATLARGECPGAAANTPVTDGPFRYIRNPIYLAGITLLLGVGLLYVHLASRGPGLAAALIRVLSRECRLGRGACAAATIRLEVRRVLRASPKMASSAQCPAHGLPNWTMQRTALHAARDCQVVRSL